MNINDVIADTLEKELFTGSLDDMLSAWLKSEGSTDGSWDKYWDIKLVPVGNYNDRYSTWLTSLGHTQGDLDGQQLAYWNDRFLLP